MKKNGYTLVELMTVIVIIGILLLIAVPAISQYMKRGMQEYHARLEESLLLAGRDYLADYRTLLPREIGNVTVIDPEELIKNGYLDGNTEGIEEDGKIKDENGKECSARVVAKRLANNKYEYDTCLICEDYQTEGEACSYDENNNVTEETKYYQVEVERDTYEVGQGEPFELPYGQAYYTKDGKKELVEEKVVGNPRIINTNKLGKTKVRYAYKGAYQEITVEVVDQVAPSIPEVVLRYENEKGNLYRDNWYSGDIYQEFQSLDYSKPGVMGSGIAYYEISTDGEHYQRIEGNHQTTTKNGEYTYYVRSVDKAGNTGEAKQYSFKIDQEIPGCSLEVTSGTPGQDGWYTSDVTIGFIEEQTKDVVSEIFSRSIDNPKITENTKEKKVTGIVTDLAGNTKTCSITVKLDKTTPNAPTIKASDQIESNQWHNKDFTLNYSGANNISGNVYYYGTTADPKTAESSTLINQDTTGTTYYVKVCSKAGLCSSNNSYIVKLDRVTPTAPTITVSDQIGSNQWHKAAFTLNYSGASNISGNVYYYGTTADPKTEGNSTTINQNSTSGAGTTYYVKVCSKAGLCSSNNSYIAKLDTVTPNAPSITASDGKESGSWHGADFTLNFSGASNVSGNTYSYGINTNPNVDSPSVGVNGNTAGAVYYAKVCSGAGLCSGNNSYTVKMDKTQPSIPSISSGGIASGSWHTNDFDITCGVTGSGTSNLTCYYGTDPNHMTPGNGGSVRDNTAGQNHYFKVCNEAMVCSDLVTYDAKLDKTGPTISGNTNGYIQWGTSGNITNYFNLNYGVSGSGNIQCRLDNGNVVTDISQLTLGVNTVTCTITSVSGRSSSASVTFRHQYPATVVCSNGGTLNGDGVSCHYESNESVCGVTWHYGCDWSDCATGEREHCVAGEVNYYGQCAACGTTCTDYNIKYQNQKTFQHDSSYEQERAIWCSLYDKCKCWNDTSNRNQDICRGTKYDYNDCIASTTNSCNKCTRHDDCATTVNTCQPGNVNCRSNHHSTVNSCDKSDETYAQHTCASGGNFNGTLCSF